jgi:hypothetical protein
MENELLIKVIILIAFVFTGLRLVEYLEDSKHKLDRIFRLFGAILAIVSILSLIITFLKLECA